jgi:hypothetical protein
MQKNPVPNHRENSLGTQINADCADSMIYPRFSDFISVPREFPGQESNPRLEIAH